jgi:hypothetical protein
MDNKEFETITEPSPEPTRNMLERLEQRQKFLFFAYGPVELLKKGNIL